MLPASSNSLHRRCVYASKVVESQSQILRSSMGGLSLSTHSSHEGSKALTQSKQSLTREKTINRIMLTCCFRFPYRNFDSCQCFLHEKLGCGCTIGGSGLRNGGAKTGQRRNHRSSFLRDWSSESIHGPTKNDRNYYPTLWSQFLGQRAQFWQQILQFRGVMLDVCI